MATKEFFPGIEKIKFEGKDSKNPMAFRYYDAEKVINGKKMKDWLKFSMAWWHTLCAEGGDQFGSGTKLFPWNGNTDAIQAAKDKMDAGFEFMQKMGIEYYCFHDVDLVSEGASIEEYEANLKEIVAYAKQKHAYNPSHFPKREKETSEMDATNKTVTVKRVNVRYLTVTAMLSAVAYILMFLDFSVPFMPSFIKMDLSELPALIGSFAMGPLCGVIICLVKNVLHLFITSTGGVGELSNFILGVAFVLPAGLLYKYKKTRTTALIGSIAGAVIMGAFSIVSNYFLYIRSITISCHRRQCLEHIS